MAFRFLAAVFALMTMSAVVAVPWQWKFFLPSLPVAVMRPELPLEFGTAGVQ